MKASLPAPFPWLARLRDLCDKATPGPWYYGEDGPDDAKRRFIWGAPGSGRWKRAPDLPLEVAAQRKVDAPEVDANWRLMTEARAAIPALLDALLEAEGEAAALRAELDDARASARQRAAKPRR